MTAQPSPSRSAPAELFTAAELTHAALEAVVTVNSEQRIVAINPAALAMFGLTHEQALGVRIEELIPDRMHRIHARHVGEFESSEQTARPTGTHGQVIGRRSSGKEFPVEVVLFKSETIHPWGRETYVTTLLRDLSDVSRMGSVIDRLNERLRLLFERVPVAIWIIENEQVVFANPASAHLIGLQMPEQLLGRGLSDLLSPGSYEGIQQHLDALEKCESIAVLPGVIRHVNGSQLEVELVVTALPDRERRFVQVVINDVNLRTREKRDLLRSRRALRELSASMVEAREEERQRIARELHDELGQRLSALKLEMTACMKEHPHAALARDAKHMFTMLDETVASVRRIAMDLRPLMLDDLGLAAAIEWQAQEFRRRSDIEVELRLARNLGALPPKLATTLYRIVQEALTNIGRHARATAVVISLDHGRGQEVHLAIQDNGIGLPTQPQGRRPGSFGLLGIRERVLMLGGRLSVGNVGSGGARLSVRVPLNAMMAVPVDEDTSDVDMSSSQDSSFGPA